MSLLPRFLFPLRNTDHQKLVRVPMTSVRRWPRQDAAVLKSGTRVFHPFRSKRRNWFFFPRRTTVHRRTVARRSCFDYSDTNLLQFIPIVFFRAFVSGSNGYTHVKFFKAETFPRLPNRTNSNRTKAKRESTKFSRGVDLFDARRENSQDGVVAIGKFLISRFEF